MLRGDSAAHREAADPSKGSDTSLPPACPRSCLNLLSRTLQRRPRQEGPGGGLSRKEAAGESSHAGEAVRAPGGDALAGFMDSSCGEETMNRSSEAWQPAACG